MVNARYKSGSYCGPTVPTKLKIQCADTFFGVLELTSELITKLTQLD